MPGKAFWLICREAYRLSNGAVSGYSTSTDEAYEITLAPGWNQVGNPYCFPVAWAEVLIDGSEPGRGRRALRRPHPLDGVELR